MIGLERTLVRNCPPDTTYKKTHTRLKKNAPPPPWHSTAAFGSNGGCWWTKATAAAAAATSSPASPGRHFYHQQQMYTVANRWRIVGNFDAVICYSKEEKKEALESEHDGWVICIIDDNFNLWNFSKSRQKSDFSGVTYIFKDQKKKMSGNSYNSFLISF